MRSGALVVKGAVLPPAKLAPSACYSALNRRARPAIACRMTGKRSAQTLFMQRCAVPGALLPCLHSGAGRQAGREHEAVNVGIKHRAHCLTCGGAALFFLHLRITWLEVNGAGAAVQLALPG